MVRDFYMSSHKRNLSLELMTLVHLSLPGMGQKFQCPHIVLSARPRRDAVELFKELFRM